MAFDWTHVLAVLFLLASSGADPTYEPTARPSGICPSGWLNFGDKCYFKTTNAMTHDQCVTYCFNIRPDATLTCIQNAEQNAFIQQNNPGGNIWIGYNDVAQEGHFQWPAGCNSSYVNWRNGEPNDGIYGNYVQQFWDGQWIDNPNGNSMLCMCEYNWLNPTLSPTAAPSDPSASPTYSPSLSPFVMPTEIPSAAPTLPSATLNQIRTSPTYKVRNAFSFAVRSSNNAVFSWGEGPHGGDTSAVASAELQGVAQVVPGRYAFAARRGGSVVTWGSVQSGPLNASFVTMVANEAAFVGINSHGKVYAVGSPNSGGDIEDPVRCPGCAAQLAANVTKVVASAGAFAAIKTDGSVFVWGGRNYGGDAPTEALASVAGAVLVVATRSAFAALLPSGEVVTWGDSMSGGDSSAVQSQLHDVVHITASPSVFVAFKSDLTIVTWGNSKFGGDSSQVLAQLVNVVFVAHTLTAMAALRSDGTVVTWGQAADGGSSVGVTLTNVKTIYANAKAFLAVKNGGEAVGWGRTAYGGSGAVPADLTSAVVASIHHTDRAFLAVLQSGKIIVWGQAGHGGSPNGSVLPLLVGSGVHTVCSNEVAFSVITAAGQVVAWGHIVSVPVPGVQFTHTSLTTAATCA